MNSTVAELSKDIPDNFIFLTFHFHASLILDRIASYLVMSATGQNVCVRNGKLSNIIDIKIY